MQVIVNNKSRMRAKRKGNVREFIKAFIAGSLFWTIFSVLIVIAYR